MASPLLRSRVCTGIRLGIVVLAIATGIAYWLQPSGAVGPVTKETEQEMARTIISHLEFNDATIDDAAKFLSKAGSVKIDVWRPQELPPQLQDLLRLRHSLQKLIHADMTDISVKAALSYLNQSQFRLCRT